MRILVTGASGFAGSELIPQLLSEGHRVRALARDPARVDVASIIDRAEEAQSGRGAAAPHVSRAGVPVNSHPETNTHARWADRVKVLAGDVLSGEGLSPALREVEVAYYLIHSMERSASREDVSPFPERERRAAEHFAAAAAKAGVRRIVYLGGPTASWTTTRERGAAELSPHLRSREAVERILREAVPDTVTLRASIVIGARSRSFRFLVRLVERMPVLTLPPWREFHTRPIDARDITAMLAAAATVTRAAGRSLDVGGPDILTYGEMIERIADLMLLSRPTVGLTVSLTPVTAAVAAAIAEEDPELVGALMESLQGDLLPGGQAHLRAAELLGVQLHSYDAAVEHALREWESVEPLTAR